MKTHKYLFLSILFIFMIQGCNKQYDYFNLDKKISSKQIRAKLSNKGFLKFTTYNDFESTITYLNSTNDDSKLVEINNLFPTFHSMKEIYTEKELSSKGIYDDLLASILNKNGEIQIGDYIYQVQIPLEVVYRILANKYTSPASFNNKSEIEVFSIYDELTEKGIIVSNKRSCCSRKNKKGPYYFYMVNGEHLKYKLVYQSSFFYHALLAKIKRTSLNWGGPLEFGMHTVGYNYYTKCKRHTDRINFSLGGNRRVYSYRIQGKMAKYKLRVQFSAGLIDNYGTSYDLHFNTLGIHCP